MRTLAVAGRCGIYDATAPDVWEVKPGIWAARCSTCQRDFTHHRRDSAIELHRAHFASSEVRNG